MTVALYSAAPLDRTAQILTAFVWALAGALAALGAVLLASGETPAGRVLLASGVLDAVLCVVYRRQQPMAYDVNAIGVTVERRAADPSRFSGQTTVVPNAALGLRTMGSGGLYGYLGRFRLTGGARGPVKAFVTDRSRAVVVDVAGRRVALSPTDRDELFVELEVSNG